MTISTIAKIKDLMQHFFGMLGYEIIISGHKGGITVYNNFPKDMDGEFKAVYELCRDYTATSIERMYGLFMAIKFVIDANIPGDFVECGVWKGGSAMLMAQTLLNMQETARKIYLYDTFAGMTKPTEKDTLIANGSPASKTWKKMQKDSYNAWAFSPIEEVKSNMLMTNYPQDNIVYVKGKVEDTIPAAIPDNIALLRLDTDWYESTYHELKHLFPLLAHGGVLIIDDYGHFAGAKEAVDTYFKENRIAMLLNRIDYTGRIGIKI
jgi:O-methyltransferase